MACPICFFRDSYQRSLKLKTFGCERFEQKLENYKKIYIDEIKSLNELKACGCYEVYSNQLLCQWIDLFLLDLRKHVNVVESTFDHIILSYKKLISENQRAAINCLYQFLVQSDLLNRKVVSSDIVRPYFRARWKGQFDPRNIKNLYHIPFSKRQLVASQRFSIQGLPLLYLGSSILSIEKELEADLNDQLEYSLFLPRYSKTHHFKIFDLNNSLNNLLENNLPGLMDSEIYVPYSGDDIYSYKPRFIQDIQSNILMQVCSFPTQVKNAFIPEYVIPQLLTVALQEHEFDGLSYPSTKCFESLKGNHRFSKHHLNLVLFTKYSPVDEYDEDLLNRFFTFTFEENTHICVKDVLDIFEDVVELNRKSEMNLNEYVMPLVRAKLQIEYLENSLIRGVDYFGTASGKTELGLYQSMAKLMLKEVKGRLDDRDTDINVVEQ